MAFRRIAYLLQAGLLILFVMWAFGYYSLLHRGSYDYAVSFVKENPTVKLKLGEITENRLGYFNFKEVYSGGRWTARFNIILRGRASSGVAFFELAQSSDTWAIKKCDLETSEGLFSIVPSAN